MLTGKCQERGVSEAWSLWKHIPLMRNVKLFIDMYTEHCLLKSLDGAMILHFKVGDIGLITGQISVFISPTGFYFVVMKEASKGLSLSLNPAHVISLSLFSSYVDKGYLQVSFLRRLSFGELLLLSSGIEEDS